MRNRTELVTNNLPDSENDEEELDDSEEDWKPEKVIFFFFCNIEMCMLYCVTGFCIGV